MGWWGRWSTREQVRRGTGEAAQAISASAARTLQASAFAAGQPGFATYDKMQKDAQVRASLNLKKLGALAARWEVVPANASAEAQETADFARFCLDQMNGSATTVLWKAMDALAKGFAVLEMIYELWDNGPFAGKVILKQVKAKDPQRFGFDVDEFLNIRSLQLLSPDGGERPLPREKFVLYAYGGSYESPWGEPDLRAAYQHWFVKTAILKFWASYLEKYGSPTAMGVYKRGMPPESQDELLSVLERLQQENALVVPEDVQVQLLQALENGGRGYLEAVEYHNQEIARAILGQTLTTDEGRRGSLALGQVHFDVMMLQLEALRRELADAVMTEQVIRPLVAMNYSTPLYPRFRFVEDRPAAAVAPA